MHDTADAPTVINLWPDRDPALDHGQTPTLTLYPCPSKHDHTNPGARPALLVLPGGGYGHLAPHEGQPLAQWANGLGLHAAVLHYRVARNRHPKMIHDAQRAIRLLRANPTHLHPQLNIDPDAVAVLGFSAGGHLASTLTVHHDAFIGQAETDDHDQPDAPAHHDDLAHISARPDAAILCYPVIDLHRFAHLGSRRNLLGAQADDDQLAHQLSNHQHITPHTPPCFLWHTADDPAVDVRNSLQWASACRDANVPCELHVFPHGRHGLGMAEEEAPDVAAWTTLAARFLHQVLIEQRQGIAQHAAAAPQPPSANRQPDAAT